MTASRAFLLLCLSFLGGISFSSIVTTPQTVVWGVFILGSALASAFWIKNKKIVVLGFCLIIFALGVYRHQTSEPFLGRAPYLYSDEQSAGMLSDFRGKLSMSIDKFLSPPQSSVLGAMMLGEKERMSYELKEKLNKSGTRHITAISGMHVMIIAGMLVGAGIFLGMWRGQAFYFALALIVLFILMVGSPPSAIRAGIMGGIVLFAEKVGRLSQAHRLLIIAAAVMLAFNPLLLRFDIGFQLSFLATFGIAKLSPWFREKLLKIKIPDILGFKNTLAMTFPAVIFTAPILAANFGQVSLISIVTNILIIPVIPLIFAFGFLASFTGIILSGHSTIPGLVFGPVWLFLTYIYKVIDISAALPFAALRIESFPWYLLALYFVVLFLIVKYFKLEK